MAACRLMNIPDDLWARVTARATREDMTIRTVLLRALQRYADAAQAAGGRKAAAGMTATERRARAQKAARTRWSTS